MARIKITLPDSNVLFKTTLPLMVNYINYGGHMGNDAVLTLAQEARIRYLKTLGHDELNFFGKSLIQADAAIVYKSEAHHGDDLEVEIYIGDITDYGFDFFYQFKKLKTSSIVAVAKTGMVFFDYDVSKIQKCPEAFLETYS